MESASPMNSLHTPSPGWNPTVIIHTFIPYIIVFLLSDVCSSSFHFLKTVYSSLFPY